MTTYRIQTNKTPTFWNEDIWTGIGASTFIPFIGPLLGGIVGGWLGKKSMQSDLETGKLVSEPTYLNKGILQGGAKGSIIGSIVGALAFAGILSSAAPMVAATGAIEVTVLFMASPLVLGALGTAAMLYGAITIAGAVIGAISKKHEQEREFQAAQQQHSQEIRQGKGRSVQAPSHEQSQSIENGINYRTDFSERETARRSQSNARAIGA